MSTILKSYSWTGPEKYPLGKSATVHPNTFSKLQYRLDATRRAIHRTLQALKQLQAEAGAEVPSRSTPIPPGHRLVQPEPPSLSLSPQTPSPGIGFVPSTPAAESRSPPHCLRADSPKWRAPGWLTLLCRTSPERNLQNGPGILVYHVVYMCRYSRPMLCWTPPEALP